MCVAIPARVTAVTDEQGTPMATVVISGNERQINCSFLPDVAVGEHLLTHSGFAVRRLGVAEAAETTETIRSGGGG
jgi:hydrogenase expression/formation protein HypC